MPLAPGGNEYGCECENPGCDIWFSDVAPIPDFADTYCECLCEAGGCGEPIGGEAEASG